MFSKRKFTKRIETKLTWAGGKKNWNRWEDARRDSQRKILSLGNYYPKGKKGGKGWDVEGGYLTFWRQSGIASVDVLWEHSRKQLQSWWYERTDLWCSSREWCQPHPTEKKGMLREMHLFFLEWCPLSGHPRTRRVLAVHHQYADEI